MTERSDNRSILTMIWTAVVSGLFAAAAGAQAAPPATSATCRANLDSLARRVEVNYGGFALEVTDNRRRDYDALRSRLGAQANGTASSECYRVLTALTDWFNDPHLFVYQNEVIDTATARQRRDSLRIMPVDEASVRRDLVSRGRALDPIEGIWYQAGVRMAIVREPRGGAGRFIGVLLESDTTGWPAGAVRAQFSKRPNGSYETELMSRNFARRTLHSTVHKRVMLRTTPGIWGKQFPIAASDSGLMHVSDPKRPTAVTKNGTLVLSFPSHDPSYRGAVDSLLAQYADALRSAERLIIDLRGNEGGSSWLTNGILPYIRTRPARPPTPLDSGDGFMLSSPSQIAYARRAFGPDTSAFVRSLVARLQASPGSFVPLRDTTMPTPAPDTVVIDGPKIVGMLIDGGTVSASEVLVLQALRSTRTIVFGQPTAGALDYQSTSIVSLVPGERRWYLGYPTITRHLQLPRGGMRGKGIPPDVRVDWPSLADPIAFVDAALRERLRR